ncbi:DUF2125 domain-containing protein [Roseobacter sp. EG26]|uniref:DUF2125 domain-containing protein n=1 Tax=Roseobacter sp. EG26 TaxID=3412477 RepID=UPI003CE55092
MWRLIRFVLLAALAVSGWWAFATFGAVRGIDQWLAQRQVDGWQAETSAIGFQGFPSHVHLFLKKLTLADPSTGVALDASVLELRAPVWAPGDIRIVLPGDPILLATPEGRARLLVQKGRVDVSLKPKAAMALEKMKTSSDAWLLDSLAGDFLAGGKSQMVLHQDEEIPEKYTLDLRVDALRPGEIPRAALFIPQHWPVSFDSFNARLSVTFDRVWDISALEVSRPQPRQIIINQAEAVWGALQLRFAATLDIDPEGVATGTVKVQARNWRAMLALAENAGVLPRALRPQFEQALSALAGLGGNSEALDLTLALNDGLISVGFLPLGPAPRFILR